MPYRFRQSIKTNDKNVRDMVFRGYVVIYAVEIECENTWNLQGKRMETMKQQIDMIQTQKQA